MTRKVVKKMRRQDPVRGKSVQVHMNSRQRSFVLDRHLQHHNDTIIKTDAGRLL